MSEPHPSEQANETPLAILQLTMERLYLQGRLDEAAKIALKMLTYAHPRIRSIKASQRHPAPPPDRKRLTFDLSRLSEAELEWLMHHHGIAPRTRTRAGARRGTGGGAPTIGCHAPSDSTAPSRRQASTGSGPSRESGALRAPTHSAHNGRRTRGRGTQGRKCRESERERRGKRFGISLPSR